MSRIVRTGDTPAKQRQDHLRAAADALGRLAATADFAEAEARDLAAFLALRLQRLYDVMDESAHVWDERGYVRKAEALRHAWRWARRGADALTAALAAERFDAVPDALAALAPHLAAVHVPGGAASDPDVYAGAYRALRRRLAADAS